MHGAMDPFLRFFSKDRVTKGHLSSLIGTRASEVRGGSVMAVTLKQQYYEHRLLTGWGLRIDWTTWLGT